MKPNELALKPLGKALMAYWKGDKTSQLLQEYRSGYIKYIPASVFFREKKDFYPTEQIFRYCRGRILVVGAGTGVHALELERLGYQTTSLEINEQAVTIMQDRGVKDIRHCDFFNFSGDSYDTILMLGHNIGICGKINRISILLRKCESLLAPNGQVLANSINESGNHNRSEKQGYYAGEQEFRLIFEGHSGPWMNWLHVDYETLSLKANDNGWLSEKLIETGKGEYLTRLQPL